MWSRVAVLISLTASCHGGLLGAGSGEGSCAAGPRQSGAFRVRRTPAAAPSTATAAASTSGLPGTSETATVRATAHLCPPTLSRLRISPPPTAIPEVLTCSSCPPARSLELEPALPLPLEPELALPSLLEPPESESVLEPLELESVLEPLELESVLEPLELVLALEPLEPPLPAELPLAARLPTEL